MPERVLLYSLKLYLLRSSRRRTWLFNCYSVVSKSRVAPHMGAWIETLLPLQPLREEQTSPLIWGRGLKQQQEQVSENGRVSPLIWGRGLKLY